MDEDFGVLGKTFQIGFATVLITSFLNEILPSPWKDLNNIILLTGGFLFIGSFMLFGLAIVFSALCHYKDFFKKLIKMIYQVSNLSLNTKLLLLIISLLLVFVVIPKLLYTLDVLKTDSSYCKDISIFEKLSCIEWVKRKGLY